MELSFQVVIMTKFLESSMNSTYTLKLDTSEKYFTISSERIIIFVMFMFYYI